MGILDSFKRKNGVYDEQEETVEVKPKVDQTAQTKPQTQNQPQAPKQPAPPRPKTNGALSMQMFRPTSFAESPKVADCLKAGQAVVLNLEDMEDGEARRMIDYMAGVLYAVDGKIDRPAVRTFLLTPRGVNVKPAE